jgi:diamine N-acetyltransferase
MNISNYLIRIAELSDAPELLEVCRKSFFATFTGTCTEDDMAKYLAKTYSLERIQAEIAASDSLLFVLLSEDKIAGYAKVGQQIIPELKHRKAIELERLYLLEEHIGKGFGNKLMQKCLEVAAEKKSEVIYLGVWEHNYRAQKFYKKYGFEFFGEHPFPIESTPQTDLWMKKELR